jgi:hypothetical protein
MQIIRADDADGFSHTCVARRISIFSRLFLLARKVYNIVGKVIDHPQGAVKAEGTVDVTRNL